MSYRKEKKFRLTLSDMQLLKSNLLSQGMNELYPMRKVNSCYFDTNEMQMFHDSDQGVLPRKKIRIRNYNDEKIFTKEIKISSEEGRYKKTKKILENNYEYILDNIYGKLKPTLFISYFREYFFLKGLRITFDRNIEYENLRMIASLKMKDHECVMEIKTSIDVEDNYITKVIDMPTSRFSKYCRGIMMFKNII